LSLSIAVAAGALAASVLVGAPAEAQQVVWTTPPVEYITITEPVYYQNHPHYWYQGHWYWRDEHGGWNHYDHEPDWLIQRRPVYVPHYYWGGWHRHW
jgi:hypothetical protein